MYIFDLDIGPGLAPPMALPGIYTVELSIGKNKWEQKVQVLKDPDTKASINDIIKQHSFAMQLYSSIKTTLQMIEEIENHRSALLKIADSLADKKNEALVLEEELWQIESKLHDINQTGSRQDIFRSPAQLLERFLSVSKESQVASADYPPTEQHQQVYKILAARLNDLKTKYDKLKQEPPFKSFNLK